MIRELARVFTGLAHSFRTKDGALFENNWFQLGDLAYVEEHRWTNPMKFFTNQHDYGEKILFTDNSQLSLFLQLMIIPLKMLNKSYVLLLMLLFIKQQLHLSVDN